MPASEEKKEEWRKRIITQKASKLTKTAWCRQNQVSADMFSYWDKKLFPSTLSFNEVTDPGKGFTLECKGIQLYLEKCPKAKELLNLLSVLLEVSC